MTDFDKNVLPKEHEVISVWISKYDQARGQKRQLSKIAKVIFIYYVSTFIAQNLILQPNFS